MENQKTIKKEIEVKGRGIHRGESVSIKFLPAAANTGIVFKRIDIPGSPTVRANIGYVLNNTTSPRQTSLRNNELEVHTVEHVMATLSGLEVDNIMIELDGNEIPALDGSSQKFLEALHQAGIQELQERRNPFVLKEPVWVEYEDAYICALPYPRLKISYTLSYDSDFLKTQFLDLEINPENFKKEISSSRTFVLESEAEDLRKQGYGKGANYDNTLVVSDTGVLKNKMRFEDECLRHKILDLIGDLYLLGQPLCAHIIAVKSGHYINHQLVRKLLKIKEHAKMAGLKAQSIDGLSGKSELDISEIMRILPHRYPFLLIDRIIELEKGKRAVGIKNVTANELFFNGHFPGRPVMPGVLIMEALAQVGGVLMLSPPEHKNKLAFFMSMNNVKFRKTVVPGDQVCLEVTVGKIRSKTGQLRGEAFVDGKVVAEADLMFALVDE